MQSKSLDTAITLLYNKITMKSNKEADVMFDLIDNISQEEKEEIEKFITILLSLTKEEREGLLLNADRLKAERNT